MNRKPRATSPTTKRRPPRRPPNLQQLEERLGILLALLHHNIDKLLRHKKAR